ncbi:MAG: CotH kinase family protein [Myxococcota bacterium]
MWWLAACAIEPQDAEATGVEWADDEASAFVFRDDRVVRVDLTIDPDRRPAPGQVVHAALELDGARYPDVGVALAGAPDDPSLVVLLDRWTPASHRGLTAFELHQHPSDPTLAREATSARAARLLGLPAPRVGFAEVRWNEVPAGVFLVVERQDAEFVERRLGWRAPVVFRPERGFGDFGRGLLPGDVRRSREDGPVVDDPAVGESLDEVEALLSAPPTPDAVAALFELVPQEAFLTYLAWEVVVGHADGYPSRWRLAVGGAGRPALAWLPSDGETSWVSELPAFGGEGAARAWCEAEPGCRRAYAEVALAVADRAEAAALPDVYRAVDGFVRSLDLTLAPAEGDVHLADRPQRLREEVLAEYPDLGP